MLAGNAMLALTRARLWMLAGDAMLALSETTDGHAGGDADICVGKSVKSACSDTNGAYLFWLLCDSGNASRALQLHSERCKSNICQSGDSSGRVTFCDINF